MRWIGITLSLALALTCFAQEPPTFTPGKEAKQPAAADSSKIKKAAKEWIDRRAKSTNWKAKDFRFVGTLFGRPADELPKTRYDVYRMTFSVSPRIGQEPQNDLLFYGKGSELVWPPEQWSKTSPAPGQMISAIRTHIKN